MVLIRQQWKSDRWTVLVWCVVVVFLTWMSGAFYRVLERTGTLTEFGQAVQSLPPSLRALFGIESFSVFGACVAAIEYRAMMSIALMVFIATYVPGLISREIDRRTSEFLLALPVKRSAILAARWFSLATSMAVITLIQLAALIAVTGTSAEIARYLLASLNMYLVFLEVGTFLLLVSVFVDDYSRATGVCAGLATLLFYYNGMTENATGFLLALRKALPFARFDFDGIIASGRIPGRDMALLAAGTAVLLFLAARAFERKQVAS